MNRTARGQLFIAALASALLLSGRANAEIKLNELFVGPEDRFDGDEGFGREFFELRSTTGGAESLAGLWLLEINGTGGDAGLVEQAISLSDAASPTTGSNGLFLWRDDKPGGQDLVPNPDPATVQHVQPFDGSDGLQADDVATYLLVSNYDAVAAPLGTDLDTNDDGTLDLLPWDGVNDALGVVDGVQGVTGFSYAAALGGVSFELSFGPDAFSRIPSTGLWFAFDSPNGELDPAYFGPFFAADGDDFALQDGSTIPLPVAAQFNLTPGSTNEEFVPEPSTFVLAAGMLAGLLAGYRRQKKNHC